MFAQRSSSSFQGWQRKVFVSIACQWVCSCMSVAEFQGDVLTSIPAIAERLKDFNSDVCKAAIELLSRLEAQGTCWHHFPVGVLKRICS